MSASLREISIQISCIRAEESSVGLWTTVWEPDHGGMFPKLLSRALISRETVRSINRGGNMYMVKLLKNY